MKTNSKKNQKQNTGLLIRPEQLSTENQPTVTPEKTAKSYVNYEERERNRLLTADKVLASLKRWNPRQYELAEVVGKWVWITFPEPPVERVRAELSQLGFHWNNHRKCWQHPCGQFETEGSGQDPRQKYGSYFAAQQKAA